jgi:hypothetical protein
MLLLGSVADPDPVGSDQELFDQDGYGSDRPFQTRKSE